VTVQQIREEIAQVHRRMAWVPPPQRPKLHRRVAELTRRLLAALGARQGGQ
jgi:hypothetical protein